MNSIFVEDDSLCYAWMMKNTGDLKIDLFAFFYPYSYVKLSINYHYNHINFFSVIKAIINRLFY